MAFLPQRLLRLQGFTSTFLTNTGGLRGEIYYDNVNQSLRIMDGSTNGGYQTARADLVNVSNATFAAKATAAGVGTGGGGASSNSFTTISVAGQSNVVADSTSDILSLVAGTGISITTNASTDAITINSTVTDSNTTYGISAETGVAGLSLRLTGSDASTDNVYLEAGNNITITRVDANTIRFSSSATADYADLANKPVLQFSIAGDDSTQQIVNLGELIKFTGAGGITVTTNAEGYVTITGPTLAAVATTGDYSSLSGTPSIPAAYSATSINALLDVDTTTTPPTAGQVLKWNGTNWVPAADATTGGAGTDADTLDGLDSTYFLNFNNLSNKPNIFSTIAVAGQSNVVADSNTDTLTFTAGTGITLTTDASTDSITVSNTGVTSLLAGAGISLTASTGAVTISNIAAQYSFYVAGDDSTQRVINSGETVKFLGASGITVTTDVEGQVTISGSSNNTFANIAVAGQNTVSADSTSDTLTLVAGTGISLSTDSATDTVTITNSSPAAQAFGTVSIAGQNNVVADSTSDTLTLVAGAGISLSTDASTDTVTITSTVSSGSATFSGTTDATAVSLTIDKIYAQAMVRFDVTNLTSTGYYFAPIYPTGAFDTNPVVYLISGTTVAFSLNVAGHPFLIQNDTGAGYSNYNTGLVHVSSNGTVSTGSNAQGKTTGTLYWHIPYNVTGTFRYLCSIHFNMTNTFNIRLINTI